VQALVYKMPNCLQLNWPKFGVGETLSGRFAVTV
jgi:hypothetical protein